MIDFNFQLIIILCVVIIIGFLYCYINCTKTMEAMETMVDISEQCPNVLIQDGSGIYLKNNRLADIPGVNPIRFENLEEYTEFYKWQKSQGINCPALVLQKSYNAQSEPVFKFRPDLLEPEGGLNMSNNEENLENNKQLLYDANRNNPPYNNDSYPGFDPKNQYIGSITPLDTLSRSPEDAKADAMSSDWAGIAESENIVKSGAFKQDEVFMKVAN